VDHEQLFAARTRVGTTPLLPELSLHIADAMMPLWQETAREPGAPPPYWGCPWVGGQALARYLLDHHDLIRGRTVLDVGTGSGVVAIAAARAGASSVIATDIDPRAVIAARRNAALNHAAIEVIDRDVLDDTRDEAIVLAGDLCYESPLAERVFRFLRAHAARCLVLVGDPGRAYFASDGLELLARYDVAATRDVEGRDSRTAGVFRVCRATLP
jgi:predicted nicotinamide N-methyase